MAGSDSEDIFPRDGREVWLNYQIPESAIDAYHRQNEAVIKTGLWQVPGVSSVQLKELSAYGMSGINERIFSVGFRDQESLDNAKRSGQLPPRITALRQLRNLDSRSYDVDGFVERAPAKN